MKRLNVNLINQLKQERASLIGKSRAIYERALSEGRDVTGEDDQEFDRINKMVDDHELRIGKLEGQEAAEGDEQGDQEDAPPSGRAAWGRHNLDSREFAGFTGDTSSKKSSREYRSTKNYAEAFNRWALTGETRSEVLGTNSAGGYLVTPTKISDDVTTLCNNLVFVRERAKIFKLADAASFRVRTIPVRMSDALWTSEIASVTDDTTITFGAVDLTPQLLSKLALVSIRLAEVSGDIESVISEELAYKFAMTQENAYLNGSGSGQPLGVFTPSASGIPTSTDTVTATTGVLAADDLISCKYNIKQPYLRDPKTVTWVFSRSVMSAVRKLKDAYGQYLLVPGISMDQNDTLLNIPVCVSEYAPAASATTGTYQGILGNFSYYRIAEVADLQVQRLVERYADTNQIGFIGRYWGAAAPCIGEAFSRVILK